MSAVDIKSDLKLYSAEEYAKLRGVKPSALANERAKKKGIPFVKFGLQIYYRQADVLKEAAQSTVTHERPATLIDGTAKRKRRAP